MRRIADLYPSRAKTDARYAFIIADAARSLRPVDVNDEALAKLDVLVGFDDDLAGEATDCPTRIRGLLTGIHSALERAIGPTDQPPGGAGDPLPLPRPDRHHPSCRRELTAITKVHAPRMGDKLVEAIMTALDEQTVTVSDTAAEDTILPRLADSLKTVLQQRKQSR